MKTEPAPGLRRALKLRHLILYGIIIVQPTAPMGIYGVLSNVSYGQVVTTILIAMIAMSFTALSYGRMARVYPSAGSAYTYVAGALHPLLGYAVGWSMLMDYLLNPIICAIWCSAAAHNVLPSVPYAAWAVAFVTAFTALNLFGVQTSSRVNALLAGAMGVVVLIFMAYAVRYIMLVVKPVAGQWLLPFYDPVNFSTSRLFHGTAIAVLTYMGFDGISTMSEEVENPRRNIMLATVFTCVLAGLISALEVYVAQIAWPFSGPFSESMVDTAYVHVAMRVGGKVLFHLLNATLLVANMGSGITTQFGASRLLYGMGRENALPSRVFGAVHAKTAIPRNNVLLVGGCTLIGMFLLTYQKGAELVNCGALIAFMGVNMAALIHYKYRSKEKVPLAATAPLIGFLVSAFIWGNLSRGARLLGTVWMLFGIGIYFVMRRQSKSGVTTAELSAKF